MTAATLIAGFLTVRYLRDAASPTMGRAQALLAVTSEVALTVVMLGFWVPVSWRSSDGGIDRVAKRVHDAAIFVQSTLAVYDSFSTSTSGRTALVDYPAVRFLLPSIREAWRVEPKRGIPFNRLTEFNQKVAGGPQG